ncbi:hypothetical protein ACF0H5_004539 [Mactra antiquata]
MDAYSRSNLQQETIAHLAAEGLQPELRKVVMPQAHKTLENVRKAALVAERCVSQDASTAAVSNINDFTAKVCEQVIAALTSRMERTNLIDQQRQPYEHSENYINYLRDISGAYDRRPDRAWDRDSKRDRQFRDRRPARGSSRGRGTYNHNQGKTSYNNSNCPVPRNQNYDQSQKFKLVKVSEGRQQRKVAVNDNYPNCNRSINNSRTVSKNPSSSSENRQK